MPIQHSSGVTFLPDKNQIFFFFILRNSEELAAEALSSSTINNDSNVSLDWKNSSTKRNGIVSSARRQRSKDVLGVSSDIVANNEASSEATVANQEFSISFIEGIRRKKQQKSKVQSPILVSDDLKMDDNFDDVPSAKPSVPVQKFPAKKYIRSDEISLHTAIELKKICFGNAKTSFNTEWRRQGFYFSKHPQLRYGLMQEKGGPCGLLASVQAWILKHLLIDVQQQKTSSVSKGLCIYIYEYIGISLQSTWCKENSRRKFYSLYIADISMNCTELFASLVFALERFHCIRFLGLRLIFIGISLKRARCKENNRRLLLHQENTLFHENSSLLLKWTCQSNRAFASMLSA